MTINRKKRIAALLAVLTLMCAAVPAASAEGADGGNGGHEHRWVASAITNIRTCRLCGEQLRDVVDEEPICYSIPTDWVRYRPTGGKGTLWFPHGHADDGTVTIYPSTVKDSKKLSLKSLAEEKIRKGEVTFSETTTVAGRDAYLAEYQAEDEIGCVVSFYDSLSGYAYVWLVNSNRQHYTELRSVMDMLLGTVRFTQDPKPDYEQNTQIPAEKLTVIEKQIADKGENYPKAIAVVRNDSDKTADIEAVIKGTNANGFVVETKNAFAYSVAPGEEVVLYQTFSSKAMTDFQTELYAEPSIYYEAMGNNPDLKIRMTRDNRTILISAANNTNLTAYSVIARLLYYKKGELVDFQFQNIVSRDVPLAPGKTASGTSYCWEDYDDVHCYIMAYGKAVTAGAAQEQEQVEVLAEYRMVKGSYTHRYLILKNNGKYPCVVSTSTTAVSADGKALDHAINYGARIAAGGTVASFEYFKATEIDHFDTQMKVEDDNLKMLSPDSFKVSGRTRNTISGTKVQGEVTVAVTNIGRETAEYAYITVLFFKKDALVAGEDAELADSDNLLAPGRTATAKIVPQVEFDRYEIYLSARAS